MSTIQQEAGSRSLQVQNLPARSRKPFDYKGKTGGIIISYLITTSLGKAHHLQGKKQQNIYTLFHLSFYPSNDVKEIGKERKGGGGRKTRNYLKYADAFYTFFPTILR